MIAAIYLVPDWEYAVDESGYVLYGRDLINDTYLDMIGWKMSFYSSFQKDQVLDNLNCMAGATNPCDCGSEAIGGPGHSDWCSSLMPFDYNKMHELWLEDIKRLTQEGLNYIDGDPVYGYDDNKKKGED